MSYFVVTLEKANMFIAQDVADWPRDIRRASINSFGYGGANAHVVVESLDSYLKRSPQTARSSAASRSQQLILPVSAESKKSFDVRLKQTQDIIQRSDASTVKSLAYTLAQNRPTLRTKGFLLAKVRADGSSELISSGAPETVSLKSMELPFAFIFTGQGAQYAGMAKELLQNNESFSSTIHELDAILQSLPAKTAPTWTLEQTILDQQHVSQINHVTRSQPICTAVQIGLVRILKSWGVNPKSVVGHSSGEIAAAYAAGLLNAREAILSAYFRGYAVNLLKTKGAMLAAGVGPEEAEQLIVDNGLQDQVCVACVNSPESVTLSGSIDAVEILLRELQNNRSFARKLETGGRAYHSHLVREVGETYETLLAPHLDEKPAVISSDVQMFSSVGYSEGLYQRLAKQARKARYWRDNLEKSVQFSSALTSLIGDGKVHLIEVGPHAALKGPVQQIRASVGIEKELLPYNSALLRGEDADLCMKKLAGSLYQHGHAIQWKEVLDLPQEDQVLTHSIPAYPWDYSNGLLWYEPQASIDLRTRQHARHELLGSPQLAGNGIDWAWRNLLRISEAPWLSDHKVEDQIVFPAVGYLAIAMEAVSQVQGLKNSVTGKTIEPGTSFEFRNVSISSALVIQGEGDARVAEPEIHTNLSWKKISTTSKSTDWSDFSVSSLAAGQTTLHCSGSVRVAGRLPPTGTVKVQNAEGFEAWTMERWYSKLADEGLCFGPDFQSLNCLRTDSSRIRTDAISTTHLKTKVGKDTSTEYPVHPITIDACLQAAIMGGTGGNVSILKAFLPVFISECRIQTLPPTSGNEEVTIHTASTKTGFATKRIDCTLVDSKDTPIVDMKGVRLSLYSGKMEEANLGTNLQLQRHPALRVNWKPDILRLYPGSEKGLDNYVEAFIQRQRDDLADNETQATVAALLDLVGHNNPSMRVLELGDDSQSKSNDWASVLDKDTALPRVRSLNGGTLGDDGKLTTNNGSSGPFDAVLIDKFSVSQRLWKRFPEQILSLVGEHGVIVTRKTDTALASLAAAGFVVVQARKQIVLAVRPAKTKSLEGRDVVIVVSHAARCDCGLRLLVPSNLFTVK
jgi:acyl transferase domain-containing protein